MSYDDAVGWVRLNELISRERAAELAAACSALLAEVGQHEDRGRPGDKAHSGTRHLVELADRLPAIADLIAKPQLVETLQAIIGERYRPLDLGYRSPEPGYGGQLLHADDVPRLEAAPSSGPPNAGATVIVPLVDFTDHNGSTRIVPGSNHRIDLQRLSGRLERHADEIRLTGPAGTGFAFSGHVLHSGTENTSSAPRPALQLVFRAEP